MNGFLNLFLAMLLQNYLFFHNGPPSPNPGSTRLQGNRVGDLRIQGNWVGDFISSILFTYVHRSKPGNWVELTMRGIAFGPTLSPDGSPKIFLMSPNPMGLHRYIRTGRWIENSLLFFHMGSPIDVVAQKPQWVVNPQYPNLQSTRI